MRLCSKSTRDDRLSQNAVSAFTTGCRVAILVAGHHTPISLSLADSLPSQTRKCASTTNINALPARPPLIVVRPAKLPLQVASPLLAGKSAMESTAHSRKEFIERSVAHHCRHPFETWTSPVQQLERFVYGSGEGQLMPQRKVSFCCHPAGWSAGANASGLQLAAD